MCDDIVDNPKKLAVCKAYVRELRKASPVLRNVCVKQARDAEDAWGA